LTYHWPNKLQTKLTHILADDGQALCPYAHLPGTLHKKFILMNLSLFGKQENMELETSICWARHEFSRKMFKLCTVSFQS
jgi:hypothetical protein